MSYKDTKELLDRMRNEYGDLSVRSAITYLFSAGMDNFSPESVEKIKSDIMAEDKAIRDKGSIPFISGEYQCQIVDIANGMVETPIFELLAYFQDNFPLSIEGRDNSNVSSLRTNKVLNSALEWVEQHVAEEQLYMTLSEHIGLTDDEIATYGFDVDVLLENEQRLKEQMGEQTHSSVRSRLEGKKAAHDVSSEQPTIRKAGEPAPKKDNLDGMIAPPSTDNYSR